MAEIDILSRVLEWAESVEDIRAILLIGSRADPNVSVDELSDFDLILFLEDESPLVARDDWLERFGSVLVMFRDKVQYLARAVPTRLVQYRDGTRIDFTLAPASVLRRLTKVTALPDWLDRGYRVLLDRDQLTEGLPHPTHAAYVPQEPTESEYLQRVEEFWWESTYVARYLARGELLPAKYSAECVLRFDCLIPMLEWLAQTRAEWRSPIGSRGRGLPALLTSEDRQSLYRTFAGPDPEDNWEALFAMADLFRHAAQRVADDLGFSYPEALDRDTEAYLRRIRSGR